MSDVWVVSWVCFKLLFVLFCRSDEVDILMMDLERANQKQTTAEKELEALKGQLQSTTQSLQQAEQMQKAPNVVRSSTFTFC